MSRWQRRPNLTLVGWILVVIVLAFGIAYAETREPVVLVAGAVLAAVGFRILTWNTKIDRSTLIRTFPEAWRRTLQNGVPFYNALNPPQKEEFEVGVQLFLRRARFHAVNGASVDDELRVIVAATAVVLVFNRPDLDLPPVRDVVIQPGALRTSTDKDHEPLAAGLLLNKRTMGLSLMDVHFSLQRAWDGYNVLAHEFAHALDGIDGSVDGIPGFLGPSLVKPWCDLVRREMERVRSGDSLLRDYAATSDAEFFAVAVEAYMEQPQKLRRQHPDLFEFLDHSLGGVSSFGPIQLVHRLSRATKVGRNFPCPCGSGKKFKKCCLNR